MSGFLVPVVETDRLRLREWRDEDLDAYAAATADPEVTRFLGGPIDRAQTWRSIAAFAGHWQLRGYGLWVVERRDDGTFLGRAGLWNPEGWPGIELGWTLVRGAWGSGYATEAARAAMGWAHQALGLTHLISVIAPGNARSIRVAQRLGMRLEREGVVRPAPGTEVAVHEYGIELDDLSGNAVARR